MRILHLIERYPGSSCAGRWCQGLVRALSHRGVEGDVLCFGVPGGDGPLDLDGSVRVRRFAPAEPLHLLHRARRGRCPRPARPWSGRLRGALVRAALRCDVLQVHGSAPHAELAALVSRLTRRSLLLAAHLHAAHDLTPALRQLARSAEAVVCLSEDEANWMRQAGARRVVSVSDPGRVAAPPAGRSVREVLGIGRGERLVVFAGGGGWESGVATCVDAVRLLRLAGHPLRVALVGSGGNVDEYLGRLWQASLVPVMDMPAPDVEERARLFEAADAVVLADDWCDGAAREAGAGGAAVLVPRHDVTSCDAVRPFASGDAVALAQELRQALAQPRGVASAIGWSLPGWSRVAEAMEEVYRGLVARSI